MIQIVISWCLCVYVLGKHEGSVVGWHHTDGDHGGVCS